MSCGAIVTGMGSEWSPQSRHRRRWRREEEQEDGWCVLLAYAIITIACDEKMGWRNVLLFLTNFYRDHWNKEEVIFLNIFLGGCSCRHVTLIYLSRLRQLFIIIITYIYRHFINWSRWSFTLWWGHLRSFDSNWVFSVDYITFHQLSRVLACW